MCGQRVLTVWVRLIFTPMRGVLLLHTVAWVGIHWGSIHWLQAQKIPLRPVANIGIPTPFEHSGMLINQGWKIEVPLEPPGLWVEFSLMDTLIHVVIGDFIREIRNHWDKLILSQTWGVDKHRIKQNRSVTLKHTALRVHTVLKLFL